MNHRVLINLSINEARSVDTAISTTIGMMIDSGDISHQMVSELWDVQERLAPRIQQREPLILVGASS